MIGGVFLFDMMAVMNEPGLLLKGSEPLIMGILNTTPDSFSDGGKYISVDRALQHARSMMDEGCHIIDIGGESTRPGSASVDAATQLQRVIPVIESLVSLDVTGSRLLISIDTTLSRVAECAILKGARLINDTSAGLDDKAMFEVAARHSIPMVLMHRLGNPKNMQDNPKYHNVVDDIRAFFDERIYSGIKAGLTHDQIILDPGIGFGKTREHNFQILANLDKFVSMGFPILLGASRKRFMGAICRERDPVDLIGGTAATTVIGVLAGVRLFRVHDVRVNRQAAEVTRAIHALRPKNWAVNDIAQAS